MTTESKNKSSNKVRILALIGILSALVFVLSKIQLPIGSSGSRLHFGNIICILGGLLFGPFVGGLSAGLGSMIFDLTDPKYMPEFWITFITKFVLGFLPGFIMMKASKIHIKLRILLSSICGMFAYITLYMLKNYIKYSFFMEHMAKETLKATMLEKFITSSINGVIAIIACYFLAQELLPALKKSKIFQGL